MSIYTDEGYRSRKHYIKCVAEEYGVPVTVAFVIADTLGKDEDFDGLLTALEDYAEEHEDDEEDEE